MLSYAEKDHTLCRRGIINNSLTKPEQFERSAANVRPAWLLISEYPAAMVVMTSRELTMKALSVLSFMAGSLAFSSSALAHCGLIDLALDQAISQKNELRRSENAQVVRDLRTLREAAFILDANKHTAECQRLVAVVRELVADPKRAIETSGDTDEDKAEVLEKTRRPKTAALMNAAQ